MAAAGAIDAFMTFGSGTTKTKRVSVQGETEDTTHKGLGSCQLLQYNLGLSLDTAPGTETDNKMGDTATHAPELKPVQATKMVDVASPVLMQLMSQAAIFEEINIWQRKAGTSQKNSGDYFWKISLGNAHISEMTWSADSTT